MRKPIRPPAAASPARERRGGPGQRGGPGAGVRGTALLLGLLATATGGLTACGGGGGGGSSSTTTATAPGSSPASPTGTGTASPSPTSPSPSRSTPVPPPKTTTAKPASCVSRTMSAMSTAQQVGQLFMTSVSSTGMTSAQSAAISGGRVGSVFLMGHTNSGTAAVRRVTDKVRTLAPRVKGSTVRMLVSTDQEGGQIQVLKGPGFSTMPSAAEQGKLPPSTLQKDARTWAGQLKAAGVTMNLAPVADTVPPDLVDVNAPIGKLQREYGTDPATVAAHSTAFLRGTLQAGLLASPKHFPGLGRVTGNTDFTAGVTDRTTTRDDPYLEPFRSAVKAGTPFVMVSTAIYSKIDPKHQAAFSSTVMRGILRGSLGFQGVIISDDLGQAKSVTALSPAQRAVAYFKAGGNLLLTVVPSDISPMTKAVISRMPHDAALRSAVSDSLRRVLTAKQKAGLLSCG